MKIRTKTETVKASLHRPTRPTPGDPNPSFDWTSPVAEKMSTKYRIPEPWELEEDPEVRAV